MKHMESRPDVGIVQGRKRAADADASLLARFISAERRFSTLLDHTTYASLFDAAHFAGSAALIRRDVPPSIDGWSHVSLTEDIEFAVRLHTQGTQTILYDDRIEVDESLPTDFAALVRQRGRWARGWGRVFTMHFGAVVRAAGRIGWRTSAGLSRQLLTAVNAPWSVFLPLLGLLWVLQGAYHLVPAWATWSLAAFILPSRFVSYATAAWLDADRPWRGRAARAAWSVVIGYAWIGLAWLLQLHAIYLEMSGTPRRWMRTREPPRTQDSAPSP